MRVRRSDLARLEWHGVLAAVRGEARTPMGARRVAALRPVSSPDALERAQARAEEMRRLHAARGRLPLAEVTDPGDALSELGVRGRTLSGTRIYEVVHLLAVARRAGEALREADPEAYPHLGAEWARFPDLGDVIDGIEGHVTPAGELEDSASRELGRIRREQRAGSRRLEETLERLFKEKWTEPVLRDHYVTLRNDRYVVPVRTDAPRRFHGIVHGSSATDRTIFVEPMETVEINNRLVELRDEERREVARILGEWTRTLAGERDAIETTAERLGAVDALEAVAAWADRVGACRPEIEPGGGLELVGARHPLLETALAAAPGDARLVPLDLDMPRDTRVLLVSGPNAGGKTVALKTVGLLTLLAHAGLPVPATRARLPRFELLLADIGDEQSIETGLSTFSSHVTNLAEMLREAAPPALALIDEIGTGTDPAEGAALAMAILDRLRTAGVHVVATTHHLALKTWAYRTEGVVNAAAEFDEETLRPTYRLLTGVAGASIGMTMAGQLGLPGDVVEDARRRLDPAGAAAAATLDSVHTLAHDLQRERDALVERRRETERRLAEREAKLAEREEAFSARWRRRLETLEREFRAESAKILSRMTRSRDRRLVEREAARRERELVRRLEAEGPAPPPGSGPAPEGWEPLVGASVLVASLGREGVVERIDEERARVRLGRSSFTVARDDLRPAGAGEPDEGREASRPRLPPGVHLETAVRDVPMELELIGCRVDEGLARLDKRLDEALVAGLPGFVVIHGSGTGRLRSAVRAFLDERKDVVSWRPGGADEGGDGVTVVTLEDGDAG